MRLAFTVLGLLLVAINAHATEPVRFGQQTGPRMAAPDGSVVGLDALLGPEPLVVNIWATWCGPCREELPAFEALSAWLSAQGGQVVLIAAEDAPAEQVNRYLQLQLGITGLETFVDRAGQIVRAFQVDYYPTTLILDRNGRALDVINGTAAWDSADARRYLSRWLPPQSQ